MADQDPRFQEHLRRPKNVGDLADASVVIEVENVACGDTLRLSLKVQKGVVTAARFRAVGCSAAIAAASVMTDRISGQKTDVARALDAKAIDDALGGLPLAKRHGADLAATGLKAAMDEIDDQGRPRAHKGDP